jgi:DNA polymerase sigma
MPFISEIGDPMSAFNDADLEQKRMQQDPCYRSIENMFYLEFDHAIQKYNGEITSRVDKYKQERDKVLQKIQAIANKVYVKQSPQISMFGSLITGLALESSDMDLVVQGLNISDR